jgi:hypothetical protein
MCYKKGMKKEITEDDNIAIFRSMAGAMTAKLLPINLILSF